MSLSVTRNYQDGIDLVEDQLDDAFDSIENFVNVTKLDSTNLQSGAVAEANIATAAVSNAKLAADSVSTTKIQDAAVTEPKLGNTSVTAAKLASDAVETAKIKDAAVTTPKIADGAITATKLGASNFAESTSASGSTGSHSYVNVDGLSVTIDNCLGTKPIIVKLVPAGTEAVFSTGNEIGSTSPVVQGCISIFKGATNLGGILIGGIFTPYVDSFYSSSVFVTANLEVVDPTPSAGSNTYNVKIKTTGFSTGVSGVKLIAYELR